MTGTADAEGAPAAGVQPVTAGQTPAAAPDGAGADEVDSAALPSASDAPEGAGGDEADSAADPQPTGDAPSGTGSGPDENHSAPDSATEPQPTGAEPKGTGTGTSTGAADSSADQVAKLAQLEEKLNQQYAEARKATALYLKSVGSAHPVGGTHGRPTPWRLALDRPRRNAGH